MRILGLSEAMSGCGWHRVMLPLGFMPNSYCHVTNFMTPDLFDDNFQAILYNRFCHIDNGWDEVKKHYKVIMDLDDDWELPHNHPLHFHYHRQKARVLNNIANADLVTCTNQLIADKVKQYNPNVLILPNAIPLGEHQYNLDKQESEFVRVFWAGGSTHLNDLGILRNPVKRLKELPQIQMVLGGYTDTDPVSKDLWNRMLNIFTDGKRLNWKVVHGTKPNSYMTLYEHADIMVIPLEQSNWHACKSNLKILEAASKKIPCVVSDVAPYNVDEDCPVLFVKNQSDWFKYIKFLTLNKQARIDYGEKLYEWAKEKYNFTAINEQRAQAFRNLIEA